MPIDKALPILIVDDYRDVSRLIRQILFQLGFREVQEVTSATEALERLREQRYGLVISDWNMEPMSGLELLHKVRADPALCSLPFIMVSGSNQAEKIMAAKEAGVTDYVLKPFTAEIWKTKLRGLLGSI
jgi:two-component system chemotaxis response regulator CheY